MAGAAKLAVGKDAAILGDREGPLAQLGERRLDKAEVAGSSPARPIGRPRSRNADSDHFTPLSRGTPEPAQQAVSAKPPAIPLDCVGIAGDRALVRAPRAHGDPNSWGGWRLRLHGRWSRLLEDRQRVAWTAGSSRRSPSRWSRWCARSWVSAGGRRVDRREGGRSSVRAVTRMGLCLCGTARRGADRVGATVRGAKMAELGSARADSPPRAARPRSPARCGQSVRRPG